MRTNHTEKAKADLIIVENAVNGDERAFGKLLEKYYDSIYFLLLKKIQNEEDAEDLTMETFAKAFNNIDSYNPSYAFSTWLYRIAINNSIDHLRRLKVKPPAQNQFGDCQDNDIHSIISTYLNPEENTIQNQHFNIVKDLVRSLNPRYAQLIELRYYEEYSYEEIAQEMDIPIGTVKSQIYRARLLLIALLGKSRKIF